MSSINGYDGNAMNTLFSSLGTTNNTNSTAMDGLYGINVIDYNTIRNGSYGKLMKAYYSMEEGDKKTDSKNDTDDTDQTLRSIKDTTSELKESAQALYGSKSLFMKNADGKYDMEAIYEKVNAFIEDYNETVKAVGSAETDFIAKAGASMVNAANEYVDMFDKLGISISGADFTLSINKEKFLESNIADVKSMFSGVGSFAYQMGAKASRINNLVADKVSASGSYHSAAGSNASSSTSKDAASTIAKIKDSANNLNAVGVDLYKNRTLFNDINGAYDVDAILEEVGAFVESYNDLVIKSENSKAEGLANAVKALKNITDDYASKLEKIGISVDKEDKTLSINEDTFRASKMYNVEALFNGTASFTYKIAVKSAMVANQAETEANKANTYTEDATYSNNFNTGSIFNDIV